MADVKFDLLGDPIPEGFGKRGRPQHIPTEENRNKVRLLLGFDWATGEIAKALRITGATLRKHYFSELRHRDEARPALEANAKMMVYKAAAEGNVGAMKLFLAQLAHEDLKRPQHTPVERAAKPAALGKKAAAEMDAQSAHEGGSWSGLVN